MTPGEAAYQAYWRAWPALPLPFARLSPRERRAWEAAARAIVAAVCAPARGGQGGQARAGEGKAG